MNYAHMSESALLKKIVTEELYCLKPTMERQSVPKQDPYSCGKYFD